jgi:hypothetical protein
MPVQNHPVFQAVAHSQFPDPNAAPAWRYMEDWKFRSLLEQRALFFCRLDRMEDQFEGAWTRIAAAQFAQWFRDVSYAIDPVHGRLLIGEHPELLERPGVAEFLNDVAGQARTKLAKLRQEIALSCWHVQHCETKAMWDLYIPRDAKGVAIRSSYDRLRRAISSPLIVYMGFVAYVDWVNTRIPFGNGFWRVVYKHMAFWAEQELRLATANFDGWGDGVLIDVDLETLIDFVVVKPESGDEYRAEIEALLGKYVPDPIAVLSALDEPRQY